jgi:hypothetical protein
MIARVRDPIDGWGEVQAPLHQVSQSVARYQHRAPTETKRHAYVQDSVGGWGDGGEYTHPRQVKSCHVMTPIIAYVGSCPSRNPD